jgi:hypothetical protein
MPHTIETAPRNENVVLVEDRTFGTDDVAHWSPEAGGWVGENGEPIKFQPLHRYPMPGENYLQQGDGLSNSLSEASTSASRARRHRFFPFFLIGTTLVAAALIGVAALVRQALPTPEARQSSENEPRQEVLAKEPAEARRAVDGLNLKLQAEAATAAQSLGQEREKMAALARDAAAGKELAASTVQHALGEERARSAALATELAKARQAVETQVALSSKRGDETAQLKQAAESETAELRQSLQQEHDRAEALATELAKARQAVEQKPAAVEERLRISLPAWANNDAFVKPAQAAKQPDVAPDNSKPAIKLETVPLPKPRGRAMSADHGYGCQHNRTYDPASGTYKGYDGQRHSCP